MRIVPLLLAVLVRAAAAQAPEPPPPTVVITTARPDYRAAYAAAEARIRKRLAQRPRMLARMQIDGRGTPQAIAQGVTSPPAAMPPDPDAPALRVDVATPAVAAPLATAPAQSDAASFTVVRVTGLRAIPWKSYRAMRAAVAAYEHYKFLAPDTTFHFAVMPPPGMALPPDFQLRVRTEDGKEVPITLVNGELFQLPELADPNAVAELVSNFKGGPLRIGLLVHTASVPPEKERLGDVRLRNEIMLAIADVDHPSDNPRCMRGRRNAIECPRPRLAVWYRPRAATSGAWIVDGGRKEPLESNDDAAYPAYKMPVRAGHLSNDAVIDFAYRKPLGPLKLSQVAIYESND